jgi:UDP-GlcNAc3NAcA epimerase
MNQKYKSSYIMKILTVLGARPQFIKAATLSRAIKNHNKNSKNKIIEIIVHTGQHYDSKMSDIFFKEMDIPKPKYNLKVQNLSHGAMTGRMIEEIENVILFERPNYVLVYGDTNSTLAGALSAVKINIPIIHVEAGLRSFNNNMPEEVNRILVDRISTLLFCPTMNSKINLKNESFPFIIENKRKQKIFNVGDVMFDAMKYYKTIALKKINLKKWQLNDKEYILCTIHREENTNSLLKLKNILVSLNEISKDIEVVMPLHPRTRKIILSHNLENLIKSFKIIEPVSYFEMLRLEIGSKLIVTDSGGVQKEAFFNNIPCITLREETEWIETLESNNNILTGTNIKKIKNAYKIQSQNKIKTKKYFGNGNSAQIILDYITLHFQNTNI